ncbi:conserved phage C-terminal domain-containing protein [Levilactobacillus brevis]|uniref:conserved phage C-terminal domain-containing protein n=1 Tax=Levilactobacillus brevis TaxID=1580 RepID=UPI001EDB3362|nr:conserved phage C-terminal domain-containing protein [Levilactobacillus brevis]
MAKKSGRGITRQAVRGAMRRFTKLGFITSETTNTNTLINVVNWGSFQVKENETTSETTNEQPSDNQRTTTNKNDKNDKKKDKSKEPAVDYKKIVDYLNSETGHKYHTTDKTRRMIHARIAEGFTEHDFGMVIHYKSLEWKDNPDMQQYLRPKTLFSAEHFDDYTNEARAAASKQQRQDTSEPPVLTPEEGSARQADYMAQLEKQYAKEGESNE